MTVNLVGIGKGEEDKFGRFPEKNRSDAVLLFYLKH